jgi:hypothetical protein
MDVRPNYTMGKRLTVEEKKEKAIIDLINKMFEIAGHSVTFDDVKDRKDDWYTQWTMSTRQNDDWKEWGEKYLIKNLGMSKFSAQREMGMVALAYGLGFSDFEI